MIYQIHEFKGLVLDILKKHEVKRASLFGSIVRGEMTSESDIDLLVEFRGKKTYWT
ncbi:MAG: nucleotidyltransferase family protein [Promethearchaeota archaeon]